MGAAHPGALAWCSRGSADGRVALARGDTPPALIVLEATLELRKGKSVRNLPVENFFIDYGKQDREAGDVGAGEPGAG